MNAAPPAAPDRHASLDRWLAYQERLHPRDIELGLERVGAVAKRLSLGCEPVPTLTVAGTNGKGSSATLAAMILQQAGYRTGLYTSPHLMRYNERVCVDGMPVDDAALCEAFDCIERARGDIALTYFEFGTLAALWCFRESAVQARVLEVGLGGRLDAVNLIDADVALITSIGLDHLDWLGADREAIGREKAHVMRPQCPAFCADPDPPSTIAAHARDIDAALGQWPRDFHALVSARTGRWDWHGPGLTLTDLPMPGMQGPAYLRNASGVIAALQGLSQRLPLAREAIERALRDWRLPGRFERSGRRIYDVAHNAEAAAVLAAQLREQCAGAPISLVLGMMADKPVEAFCAALAGQLMSVYCIGLPGPRGCPSNQLAARAGSAGVPVRACKDIAQALAAAQAEVGDAGWVLVSGSFLTVAAGKAHG